ncbi:c-type cytochrome [Ruegeria arenilitoris]|uniref:c-type cytochrome n=2 Tax=Alphaproteobacteria TaxID=28211 RepID=UPI00147A5481|nr:cytochrome c [Ruegeria arenilitoris]
MIRSILTALTTALILPSYAALAQDADAGAELYQHYCATCHGIDATGHGPMAGVLIIQPTNLTELVDQSGAFPTIRVVERIDGRDPLVSHGSPMPVYGPFFEGNDTAIKAPTGQPVLTSKPIADLVAYLKTLQAG